jgi:dsDNA-specific endonuclease/ATPase MutS2
MQFSVGDKILFKKESLKGKVIKINSPYKVTIITSDGFEMSISTMDLVKIEIGSDMTTSYSKGICYKDSDKKFIKSLKQRKSQSTLKIDLHIELLTTNYEYMDNFEIVQIQLNECHNKIEKALNSKIKKLDIIHGIGQGILKNEVHNILKNYNLRFYLTKDGGTTEVYL